MNVGWYAEDGREWLVLRVRATWLLGVFHWACFTACHWIPVLRLVLPLGPYFAVHDWAEPPLRRWCEVRPREGWMR